MQCLQQNKQNNTKKQNNNELRIIQIYKIQLRSTYVIGKIYLGHRQRSQTGTLINSA